MKLAGVLFLVVVLIYFFWPIKKETEPKDTKKENSGESKDKIWKKKSLYIWLFVLQFIVLNFIYPGGLFEVKAIFWFFATRNSDKYVVIKDINNILNNNQKQKTTSIQKKIKEIGNKSEIMDEDKIKLGELANEIVNVGKPKRQKALVEKPALKPKEEIPIEKEEWRIVFTSLDKLMKREGVKQKGFFDLKVLSLLESADKKNLTISYVSSTGDKKTMELSREKKGEYYKGWFENTHPDKKRGSIKIYLLEDTASVYETTDIVTGKKNKNFPAFLGNVEDEMTVKIFKRVSSG